MSTLCIYHGNCADGFGAAWAVRKALGDQVEFHAGTYQAAPPDPANRDVILVDFSYKRDVLVRLAERARTVLVVDHHKTAIEDLAEFRRYFPRDGYEPGMILHTTQQSGGWPIETFFDVERSGAGLAWDFFHPFATRPLLIDHIEDRDLWRFALPYTREIQAALFSYPYDFDTWDKLMEPSALDSLRADGMAIERKHFKDIDELVAVTKRRMVIGGRNVPAASLPYTLTSDAGHKMAEGEPFAACYWDTPDGRVFSLRSRDEGLDVSEIAKQYGGGGHRNASGFRVPLARIAEFEVSS